MYTTHMTAIVIVLISLGCSMVIGLFSGLKTKNRSDFYVAGRRLGLLATTSSLTATGIGGSATIVAAVYVYTRGLPGIWMNLAAGLGLILLGLLLAGRVREMGVYSLPQIVEKPHDAHCFVPLAQNRSGKSHRYGLAPSRGDDRFLPGEIPLVEVRTGHGPLEGLDNIGGK